MREINSFNAARKDGSSKAATGFCKSLWNPKSVSYNAASDAFLTGFLGTFFAGQKRWGRDPKNIARGKEIKPVYNNQPKRYGRDTNNPSSMRSIGPCFNFKRWGCSLKKLPKDKKNVENMQRNLAA